MQDRIYVKSGLNLIQIYNVILLIKYTTRQTKHVKKKSKICVIFLNTNTPTSSSDDL